MNQTANKLEFGYNAYLADHPEITAAWGARCIFKDGEIDFLWDRQSNFGPDAEKAKLGEHIKEFSVIDAVRRSVAARYELGDISREAAGEFVFYEDREVKVVGNSMGSHGYMYLTGFLRPANDPFVERTLGYEVKKFALHLNCLYIINPKPAEGEQKITCHELWEPKGPNERLAKLAVANTGVGYVKMRVADHAEDQPLTANCRIHKKKYAMFHPWQLAITLEDGTRVFEDEAGTKADIEGKLKKWQFEHPKATLTQIQ